MGNRFKIKIAKLVISGLLLAGCYESERFDMPDTGEGIIIPVDSMPNPFDGSNRIYLVKDGVPDYSKMSVMGFTDFAVEMSADPEVLSWYQGKDREGDIYFGCRQHKINNALENSDHYGGNQLSFMYNVIQSRAYLKNGPKMNWKITAKMALEVIGRKSFSHFSFEGGKSWGERSLFGFDWVGATTSFLYLGRGSLIYALDGVNAVNMADYLSPGEPFEMMICCVDNFYYVKFGEKTLWAYSQEDVPEQVFPLMFHPWMGAVRFYDLTIEGDYVIQESVAVQREKEYVNIQAPALTEVNGKTLLFAEGRHEVNMQTSKLSSIRSNATDIIMKHSTDQGKTWSDWQVIKGGNQGTYLWPEVIQADDKLFLFYTVDQTGKQDGKYLLEYMVSTDGGITWREGETLKIVQEGYAISTLSGHGIKSSKGTLLFPVQCRYGTKGTVAVVYSQDNGTTWHLGNMVDGLRNNSANLVEIDGKLVLYIGHSTTGGSRKRVESIDEGKTWSELTTTTIPTGNGGEQSFGATVIANGTIYHFTPSGAEKTTFFNASSVNEDPIYGPKNQKKLYIYKPDVDLIGNGLMLTTSVDGGLTWSKAKDLKGFTSFDGYIFPTGAMDAVVSGNTVIVVTEGGTAVPYEGLLIFRETAN